jgi:hypothetical protein
MIAMAGYLAFLSVLRNSTYVADPLLDTFLDMAGSLIAFTFAANAMIRFRGTHDRISLTLAFGFVLAGLIEAAKSVTFYHGMLVTGPAVIHHISLAVAGWANSTWSSAACGPARGEADTSRARPGKRNSRCHARGCRRGVPYERIFYFMMPEAPGIHPGSLIPRPWDLLPAAIYVVATVGYGWRLRRVSASLDRALFIAAGLNVICHITIAESQRGLDAPYMLAHVLMVTELRGGARRDAARQRPALRAGQPAGGFDSLTGLRTTGGCLKSWRSRSSVRAAPTAPLQLLLFDLDELKKINDKYGHLTGSQAIKRLGNALRSKQPRDRYGGAVRWR